ncbi:unnamed protein product, partial [Thlaspi arvense]
LQLWRNSSGDINDELYKGYWKGNSEHKINELLAAYDFLNTNLNNFNVSIWYNSTHKNDDDNSAFGLTRVPRSVNLRLEGKYSYIFLVVELIQVPWWHWYVGPQNYNVHLAEKVSNAYLKFLLGPATSMLFEFVKEMPKPATQLNLRSDFSSALGPLFFTWVILQLFPVILTSLVYEKEQKLRIMMKMHGLGDGPYWTISYAYFLVISSAYMLCFVIFGSVIGLKFFTLNDYSIQLVFYFLYINLQISLAFLLASIFSNVKTAAGYIMVFGSGLLGDFFSIFLFRIHHFLDTSFPRRWIIVMELYPGFSLYRGLYEFGQYAVTEDSKGTDGMRWSNLSDGSNGMKEVLIIMFVEWLVVLFIAYYMDQVVASGSGVGRSPLFFLKKLRKKPLSSASIRKPIFERQGSNVLVQMDKPDVSQERDKVEHLLLEPTSSHAIVCDNLKKVYPRRDGNPEKFAVRGMSLALPRGECFGMLGPNGAGKTSFINMMIGLVKPSSGTAYVEGLDIRSQMDEVYTSMGVCPQHDLLWETLTGREHLLFYGRLKNLRGSALTRAVEESLKSVNLFQGGVPDKQAGKYSGGMKRRLSVAISLIGDPIVVYMDEPSTGLDPASRNSLWECCETCKAKSGNHSHYLQCIGNPKELKARYGGSYVFTMTVSSNHDQEIENLVHRLSPNANKIYHLSGTQKFELPKHEVRIADVFQAVEHAKSKFPVQAWGLADTTLEDVFIKVAHGAQAFQVLS